MNYQPLIIYDAGDKPYLQMPLDGLTEREQQRLLSDVGKIVESYQTIHQQSEEWQKKADELNNHWRKQRQGDLGSLLARRG